MGAAFPKPYCNQRNILSISSRSLHPIFQKNCPASTLCFHHPYQNHHHTTTTFSPAYTQPPTKPSLISFHQPPLFIPSFPFCLPQQSLGSLHISQRSSAQSQPPPLTSTSAPPSTILTTQQSSSSSSPPSSSITALLHHTQPHHSFIQFLSPSTIPFYTITNDNRNLLHNTPSHSSDADKVATAELPSRTPSEAGASATTIHDPDSSSRAYDTIAEHHHRGPPPFTRRHRDEPAVTRTRRDHALPESDR